MADLALRLWRHGYDALPTLRPAHDASDVFTTRMLGRRAVVVRGAEWARLFYDEGLVSREKALPPPLAGLLFGKGAVHRLDGDQHAGRKALLMRVLAPERVDELVRQVGEDLDRAVQDWRGRTDVVVHEELLRVYGAAVQTWAGTGLSGSDVDALSRDLFRIVDGFGAAGRAYPRAWAARLRTDRVVRRILKDVEEGRQRAWPGTAVAEIAAAIGPDLPLDVAAVELVNVLRPTVAVTWLATHGALALAEHPEWREAVAGDPACLESFAQEVRRLTPFVPALAGRLKGTLARDGLRAHRGDFIVLDVPATDTDPRVYDRPHELVPDRFVDGMPDPYEFLPQGGGHPEAGHRCPGERVAMGLLTQTFRVLAGCTLDVLGDRTVDRERIPTLPGGGLRLRVR